MIGFLCDLPTLIDDVEAEAGVFFFGITFSSKKQAVRNQAQPPANARNAVSIVLIRIAKWQWIETTRRRQENDIGGVTRAPLPRALGSQSTQFFDELRQLLFVAQIEGELQHALRIDKSFRGEYSQ